jgi:hypothetical protein
MKKKNKKNQIRMRLSTILLCILAILLCAAPVLHANVTVPANETCYIDELVDGVLRIDFKGTANLLTGASVTQSIYVLNGGTLNMYSGTVGWFISVSPYAAGMTVYGTGFKVDDYPCDYGEVTLIGGMGTLKGSYGDGSSVNLWVWSNIAINLQPPPSDGLEKITIDIKPGGNPNNINLKSKGVVPVAVLTTNVFDASTVDPNTVTFAGAEPVRWTLDDVDDDGDKDMLFHFKTQDLNLGESITEAAEVTETTETTLTLTGKKTDLKVIQGTDTVRIVRGKK